MRDYPITLSNPSLFSTIKSQYSRATNVADLSPHILVHEHPHHWSLLPCLRGEKSNLSEAVTWEEGLHKLESWVETLQEVSVRHVLLDHVFDLKDLLNLLSRRTVTEKQAREEGRRKGGRESATLIESFDIRTYTGSLLRKSFF